MELDSHSLECEGKKNIFFTSMLDIYVPAEVTGNWIVLYVRWKRRHRRLISEVIHININVEPDIESYFVYWTWHLFLSSSALNQCKYYYNGLFQHCNVWPREKFNETEGTSTLLLIYRSMFYLFLGKGGFSL